MTPEQITEAALSLGRALDICDREGRLFPSQLAKIEAVLEAAHLAGFREGRDAAADYHEDKAKTHARDAKWIGPNREYLQGARIKGARMDPMNGPAVSYDREMSDAAAIQALEPKP